MGDEPDVSSTAALHRALDALLDVDVEHLDDAALHALVVGAGRAASRLAAVSARSLAVWDSRKLWKSNGAVRASVRLGNELGVSPESAFVEMRRARKLTDMPATFEALAEGRISVDHAELLCRANSGELAVEFPDAERMLVDACITERWAAAARTIGYWRQYSDPAGEEDDADKMVKRRKLWCRRRADGTVHGGFTLDPVNGTIVWDELKRLERQAYQAELSDDERLVRTSAQRWADALVDMATRSRANPPGARRPRPLYTILVGYETFAGRICELADGTVIAPGQLVQHLAEADIERIVFDGPDRVLAVSHRRRFTGALRRAIQVRDRHCQHPSGCDIPAPDCDVDHITPWAQTRDTSQANGRLACTTHNRDPEDNDSRPNRRRPKPAEGDEQTKGERASGRAPPER